MLPVWIGQMAAGWLRQLAGDTVEVRSAGSAPAETVNPAGKSVESVRPIRDEIRTRVEKLLAELRR
ncbi:hypothetical protein [Micromonospora sp. NPDC093244]|uniref:hypothetical protein n=1 Tax=Micromonospora sp. NPDC093244 TaxID=3155071 RepID=UPI00343FB81E